MTASARTVTVRVHVTDDTGVNGVNVVPGPETEGSRPSEWAQLVSGTVRDGWWQSRLTFPRYSMPGVYRLRIATWDRIGRRSVADFPDRSIQVADATPDLDFPTITLLAPSSSAVYDARSAYVSVPVRVRLVDAQSGVAENSVSLSIWSPRSAPGELLGYGGILQLVSGTLRDGVWAGSVGVPAGSVGGVWTLEIGANDQALQGAGEFTDSEQVGSVTIIGKNRTDVAAPVATAATVTPSEVDTLPGDASVHVSVAISDDGSGTDRATAELIPVDGSQESSLYLGAGLTLTSGTPANGTWTGTIVLPQGLPPAKYYLRVFVADAAYNWLQYVSSGYGDPQTAHWLTTSPTVTIVDSTPATP